MTSIEDEKECANLNPALLIPPLPDGAAPALSNSSKSAKQYRALADIPEENLATLSEGALAALHSVEGDLNLESLRTAPPPSSKSAKQASVFRNTPSPSDSEAEQGPTA